MDEFFTKMGIENSNTDKRERMVAEEVNGNSGAIEVYRHIALNARRQAVNQINAMFGTNISVEYRSNLNTLVNNSERNDLNATSDTGTQSDNKSVSE